MIKTLLYFPFIFSFALVCGQAPAVEWQKTYGGSESDTGNTILQTDDGGYIVSGMTYSINGQVTQPLGQNDIWVIKMDAAGLIEWQKNYGGSGADARGQIIKTSDGGYFLLGQTNSTNLHASGNHGGWDFLAIKISSDGSVLWNKTFGSSANDAVGDVKQTADGGFLLTGLVAAANGNVSATHGGNDAWVVKLSPSGMIEWEKTYGGTSTESFTSVELTADGGYLFGGVTSSNNGDVSGNHGSSDLWVVKTDASGVVLWQRCYGGSAVEGYSSLKSSTDGGYLLAGVTASNNGDISGFHGVTDAVVFKLDALGNISWQKTLGGSSQDGSYTIISTIDGGCVIAGFAESANGDVSGVHGIYDIWLAKLSAEGSLLWQKALGGSSWELVYGLIQTADTGFIIAGDTGSNDGDVTSNQGAADLWVVKLMPDSLNNYEFVTDVFQVYPNPVQDILHVNPAHSNELRVLSLIDAAGRMVDIQTGMASEIDLSHLASGMYFLKLAGRNLSKTIKIVKD